MNILFLNPPFMPGFSRASRSPAVTKGGTLYFPIWLAYATGMAEQAGHQVRLVDCAAARLDLPNLFIALGTWRPGLVVIDTSTPSIVNDAQVAADIKKQFPETFTLLVGSHPSALPQESIALHAAVDGAALGEYDATVVDLAQALDQGLPLQGVPGLAYRMHDTILCNPRRPMLENLDALPFVAEVYAKHLRIEDYFFAAANYPMVQIMTGRGCPHRCFFCVYPQTFHSRRYRVRSAANVVDEFAFIRDHLPQVREIGIEDDCFTASPSHVRQICEELLARQIHMKWYCNVRGDVSADLLHLMRRAGCRLVTVGFESGDQKILDGMGKHAKLEKYQKFVRDARQAGLLVHGCMMVGNPGDTRATVATSYQFAVQANCDSMQFYPLFVYPGTEAYAWAAQNGYLKTTDFTRWLTPDGQHNCVLDTPELSAKEMVAICDYYLKKYHLRPRYLVMKLWQALCHPAEGYRSLLSAKTFFGRLFNRQDGNVCGD
ncbi:MAG: radical SAM protein [Magnetococcales bacterium]|nr:radical SAM protein [Magnetococcales bacterium]